VGSESDPSLTIIDSGTKYAKARYNSSTEYPQFRKGDSLIVVESWTVILKDGTPLCLEVPDQQFCFFEKVPKFLALRPDCDGKGKHGKVFPPTKCSPIMQPKGANIKILKISLLLTLILNTVFVFNANVTDFSGECESIRTHRLQKREMRGRTFLPASLAMNPIPPKPPAEVKDEDYGLETASGSDIVKSQIWNYVAEKGASVLGMGSRRGVAKEYKTPAYQILILSKEVIKKTCPTFYVDHEHWEMTVGSFISMQQKSFRFREALVNIKELNRIKEALLECAANSTLFPFLDQNATCVNGSTPVVGCAILSNVPNKGVMDI
jgi:hypothetical protein